MASTYFKRFVFFLLENRNDNAWRRTLPSSFWIDLPFSHWFFNIQRMRQKKIHTNQTKRNETNECSDSYKYLWYWKWNDDHYNLTNVSYCRRVFLYFPLSKHTPNEREREKERRTPDLRHWIVVGNHHFLRFKIVLRFFIFKTWHCLNANNQKKLETSQIERNKNRRAHMCIAWKWLLSRKQAAREREWEEKKAKQRMHIWMLLFTAFNWNRLISSRNST